MKQFLLLLLFTPLLLQAQNTEWNTLKSANYSISYPSTWTLDSSGQSGTKFILFAAAESETDLFKENINLIIQDLTGHKLDLDGYSKLSTEQVKSMIANSKILENKRMKKGTTEYHKIIYKGDLQTYSLTFEQYYWVIKDRAYILTFTAEQDQFKNYQAEAEKILDTFALKQK